MFIKNLLHILFALLVSHGYLVQQAHALSAQETDLIELMRVSEPNWAPQGQSSILRGCFERSDCESGASYSFTPSVLIQLGPRAVVLVASGVSVDALGHVNASHASPARLNAYWLENRDDGWFKTNAHYGFASEGFFGAPGVFSAINPDAGINGFSVENHSCWQGACVSNVAIYQITNNQVNKVLGEVVASDNVNSTSACESLVRTKSADIFSEDDFSETLGCYAIKGIWHFQNGTNRIKDIELVFNGIIVDTFKTTHIHTVSGVGARKYQIKMKPIHKKMLYRFMQDHYMPVRGKNPNVIP